MRIKIAIIGAGEFQLPLVKRCKERNIETHVFAWEEGAVAKEFSDYFYPISILDIDSILAKCKIIGINGICSVASELAMKTVSTIASELHLKANSIESAQLTLDKNKMKRAFKKMNVLCAVGDSFSNKDNAKIFALDLLKSSKLIVKPSDRSGSLAVNKINDISQFDNAFDLAYQHSITKFVIVEEYLEGQEYSIESISFKGKHKIIAYTLKETTGSPHFVEVAHFQPAPLDNSTQTSIEKEVIKSLDALQITDGISHTEVKVNNGKIKIIEVGGRMGGDFIGSHLVKLSTGVDFVDVSIDISLDQFSWNSVDSFTNDSAGVVFLTSNYCGVLIPEKRKLLDQQILFEKLEKSVGDKIPNTTSSGNRFGYLIYSGEKIQSKDALAYFGVAIMPTNKVVINE